MEYWGEEEDEPVLAFDPGMIESFFDLLVIAVVVVVLVYSCCCRSKADKTKGKGKKRKEEKARPTGGTRDRESSQRRQRRRRESEVEEREWDLEDEVAFDGAAEDELLEDDELMGLWETTSEEGEWGEDEGEESDGDAGGAARRRPAPTLGVE